MTDMPAFYPEAMIAEIENRLRKGITIHTLVIWTKHPQSLFLQPLYAYLLQLKNKGIQLFINLTITGMAGEQVGISLDGKPLVLEPGVISTEETLAIVPCVIDLVGSPNRIRLRIDPVVRIQDGTGFKYTNLPKFEPIVEACSAMNIRNFTFSFLEKGMHRKVDKRFMEKGVMILSPDLQERERMKNWVSGIEMKYNVSIAACCVPGFSPSRCIDGNKLQKLHDKQLPVSLKEPKSRILCGCTESVDIGGWPSKICYSGCLYCYSSPKID
jgi:hypothetical protein